MDKQGTGEPETQPRPRDKRPNARAAGEPLTLSYVGLVGEVLEGGGGKLSATGLDTGDIRKTRPSA